MMKEHIKNETNYKWITAVKYILDNNLGMSNNGYHRVFKNKNDIGEEFHYLFVFSF